jgi:phage terminase small subunit
MALTLQQERFVLAYLAEENATKAAIMAGYSPKTATMQGSRLLTHDEVRAKIDAGFAKQREKFQRKIEKTLITKEQWLSMLLEIASASMDTYAPTRPIHDANGRVVGTQVDFIPTDQRPKGSGRAIRKIAQSASGAIAIELHPKMPALELIGKHMNWIKDQIEHSGSIGAPTPTLDEAGLKALFADPKTMALARELSVRMSQPALPEPTTQAEPEPTVAQGGSDGKDPQANPQG